MPEIEFAQDTLEYMRLFLKMGVTNQWFYRMLIGRMYYAGHHLGRRLLIEAGLQPDQWRENVHQRVILELHDSYVLTGKMKQEKWDALKQLLLLRRTADYELDAHIRQRQVNRAESLFRCFITDCFAILEVN